MPRTGINPADTLILTPGLFNYEIIKFCFQLARLWFQKGLCWDPQAAFFWSKVENVPKCGSNSRVWQPVYLRSSFWLPGSKVLVFPEQKSCEQKSGDRRQGRQQTWKKYRVWLNIVCIHFSLLLILFKSITNLLAKILIFITLINWTHFIKIRKHKKAREINNNNLPSTSGQSPSVFCCVLWECIYFLKGH